MLFARHLLVSLPDDLLTRDGRATEAEDMCRSTPGRCGDAIVEPNALPMRSAIAIGSEHGITAYHAAHVSAARREQWTLVSLDFGGLVCKGLAITPDAAV